MIKTYRKTATIKAEQFDGTIEMTRRYSIKWGPRLADDSRVKFWITTLEGGLEISPDDWIATGIDGEHWPIADDVFKRTYAELPVVPKVVAVAIEYAKSENFYLRQANRMTANGLANIGIIKLADRIKFNDFFMAKESVEVFARAWLDGYQVEGE